MSHSKTNKLLLCGTILSNVLSATVLVLTVYHHFTIQSELEDIKKRA